jgi:hypothetical protein
VVLRLKPRHKPFSILLFDLAEPDEGTHLVDVPADLSCFRSKFLHIRIQGVVQQARFAVDQPPQRAVEQ